VLVLSFVLLSTLWSRPHLQDARGRRLCALPTALTVLPGSLGLALFVLVIYAGYEGVPYYTANIDPTFIFVIFWVAAPVSSVFLGNWFRAFNPWLAFARAVRWLDTRAGASWPAARLSTLARALADSRWTDRVRLAGAHLPRSPQPLHARLAAAGVLRPDAARHGPVRHRGVERARRCLRRLFRAARPPLAAARARPRPVAAPPPVRCHLAVAGARHGRARARDHRHHDLRRRIQRRGLEHAAAARSELLLRARARRHALRRARRQHRAAAGDRRRGQLFTGSASSACAPYRGA